MRNPAFVLVVVLAAVVWSGVRGEAQNPIVAPPPPPPPPPGLLGPPQTGTGLIAGQVVDALTGKPVPEATVNLTSRAMMPGPTAGRGAAGANYSVVADAQGRFYFAALPAGVFMLTGGKTGYTRVPGVGGAGTTIELANAERVTSAVVRLLKAATMTGTLRDDSGDPIVGTSVFLARRMVQNGRVELGMVSQSTSDDRGMFRFSGLQPGEYFVCACRRDPVPFDQTLLSTLASQPLQLLSLAGRAISAGSDAVTLDESLRTFPPTFYPGSATLARATPVKLESGEERTNVDMTVPLVRAARITGRISGAQSAVTASSIFLIPVDDTLGVLVTAIPPMLVQADGRFDFANVPPGQYRLVIVHRETGARGGGPSGAALQFVGARGLSPGGGRREGAPPPPDEPPLWADEVIAVQDRSTVTVNIALQRASKVSGRIELIGTPPTPPTPRGAMPGAADAQPQVRFVMNLVNLGPVPTVQQTSNGPDGRSFSVYSGAPGKYALNVTAGGGFFVKSVVAGGVDVTELPIDLGSRDINDVVVTLSNEPRASISATTPAPMAGQPPIDNVLLVFPADRRYWQFPNAALARYHTLPLTSKGSATAANLPAGTYVVVLVPPRESVDWMEQSKMEALSRRGQTVTVVDGEKRTVEVKR